MSLPMRTACVFATLVSASSLQAKLADIEAHDDPCSCLTWKDAVSSKYDLGCEPNGEWLCDPSFHGRLSHNYCMNYQDWDPRSMQTCLVSSGCEDVYKELVPAGSSEQLYMKVCTDADKRLRDMSPEDLSTMAAKDKVDHSRLFSYSYVTATEGDPATHPYNSKHWNSEYKGFMDDLLATGKHIILEPEEGSNVFGIVADGKVYELDPIAYSEEYITAKKAAGRLTDIDGALWKLKLVQRLQTSQTSKPFDAVSELIHKLMGTKKKTDAVSAHDELDADPCACLTWKDAVSSKYDLGCNPNNWMSCDPEVHARLPNNYCMNSKPWGGNDWQMCLVSSRCDKLNNMGQAASVKLSYKQCTKADKHIIDMSPEDLSAMAAENEVDHLKLFSYSYVNPNHEHPEEVPYSSEQWDSAHKEMMDALLASSHSYSHWLLKPQTDSDPYGIVFDGRVYELVFDSPSDLDKLKAALTGHLHDLEPAQWKLKPRNLH